MTTQFDKSRRDNIVLLAAYDRTFIGEALVWNTTTEEYETANLTSGTVTMTVKDSSDVIKYNKTANLTDPSNGIFEVEFADTDSTISDIGTYTYIVEYETSTGEVYLLAYGKFEIV